MDKAEEIFEEKFSEFLERKEHEKVEAALFEIVRAAYKAGWGDAGKTLLSSTENTKE